MHDYLASLQGFSSFLDAFYFSVITMMTIGYGAAFVQPECSSLVVLIAFQSGESRKSAAQLTNSAFHFVYMFGAQFWAPY
jgi:hypothetical protein